MSAHFDRAMVLFDQDRPELAENELRQTLLAEPDHALAHALLALCLLERQEYDQATDEVEAAIHLAPELPFAHFALARVLQERNYLPQAELAVKEALRLAPRDPDYYATLAGILIGQQRWADALAAAEAGLQIDAEHVNCANLRAVALVKLGRKQEAAAAIQGTLARAPENATSHANMGWTFLEKNDPDKALEHFREALRLDPELDWARSGMVEALKARHFLYRIFLQYFLWMAKLSGGAQWAIVLGGYFGYRLLLNAARNNPELAPYVQPILWLYIAFALMTWLANPLFDMLLRFNRYGRYALSRDQIAGSNWVAACLAIAAVAFLYVWVAGDPLGLVIGLPAVLLLLPVSAIYRCPAGWPRYVMAAYTIGVLLLYVGCQVLAVVRLDASLIGTSITILLVGAFLSQFLANFLMTAEVRR